MNLELLEKLREKYNKRYNENEELINVKKYKGRILNATSIESRIERIFVLSILSYAALLGVGFFCKFLNVRPFIYSLMIVGSSLTLGTVINTIMERKNKLKEKIKEVSTANNSFEKVEERLRNNIEINKLENRNLIVKDNCTYYANKEKIVNDVYNNSNIEDNENNFNEDNCKLKINELNKFIESKQKKLDILSTKEELDKQSYNSYDAVPKSMISSLISTFSFCIPMFLNSLSNSEITPTECFGSVLGSFTAGVIGSNVYFRRKRKVGKKVLSKLNKELELEMEKENISKEIEIYKEIENTINEISMANIELDKYKYQLELLSNDKNKDNKIIEPPKLDYSYEMSNAKRRLRKLEVDKNM